MNHYYTNNNNLASQRRLIKYGFKGELLEFTSDLGVFSKDRVDYGTNVLLRTLPDLKDVKSLVDVGCGIGIIGVSINKKYPEMNVLMLDVNDRAIELANLNASNNNTKAKAIESNLYENVSEKFDMIISNPPIRAGKAIVHGVVIDGKNHLNNGGSIYVVIQKKQGAESLYKKMIEVYGNAEILEKDKGYFIIRSKNI